MNPVFTLQWSEFLMARRLQAELRPKSNGFSVLIPTSRQERGIDLAIIRRMPKGKTRVVTVQVKASRVYTPKIPKRETTRRYQFNTWFNRFKVPREADFFLLVGIYPLNQSESKKTYYEDCTILFDFKEMQDFMSSCKTSKGRPDAMFGFGFDDKKNIYRNRGDKKLRDKNFAPYLLENRIKLIKERLV